MATYQKFQSFVEAVAEKKHNLGADVLTVALCSVAPLVTNGVLADLTQIAYTNLSARALTIATSAQTTGTYKLVLNDLTLTASGGAVAPFQYVVIYNDTALNDELIAFFDYGSLITLNDADQFILDFSAVTGVLTIA